MGRKSKIESHPHRKKIIKRLASGEEYSDIVRDFPDITWDDLDYYADKKLEKILSKSDNLKLEVESDQGNETLAEVRALKARALEILTQAQDTGDLKTALLGIREARGCLELVFKAEGRIQEQNINVSLQQINIYDSPEWLTVGALLARILEPYPELRNQVAKGLLALKEAHR